MLDSVVMAMMAVLAVIVLVRQELVAAASYRVAVGAFPFVGVVVDFVCFAASFEVHLEGIGHLVACRRRWDDASLPFAERSLEIHL